MTASTTTTVIVPADRNAKYMSKNEGGHNTENLAGFFAWVSANLDRGKTTKAEDAAFQKGVKAAGLYANFQDDRRYTRVPATQTFLEYVNATTGIKWNNDKERAAFQTGVGCHTLYKKYQSSKKAPVAPAKAAPAKVTADAS